VEAAEAVMEAAEAIMEAAEAVETAVKMLKLPHGATISSSSITLQLLPMVNDNVRKNSIDYISTKRIKL
jgi:Flp pilus assembly protein CpaB